MEFQCRLSSLGRVGKSDLAEFSAKISWIGDYEILVADFIGILKVEFGGIVNIIHEIVMKFY